MSSDYFLRFKIIVFFAMGICVQALGSPQDKSVFYYYLGFVFATGFFRDVNRISSF
ncbi:hypothetical protein HOY82DRAFT_557541 [Tuber indicum]|nr:hypothetical protein HOY82DRAFT_557541 [Tuber indicum]